VTRERNLIPAQLLAEAGTMDPMELTRLGVAAANDERFERGLILLPCGECAIRFCPPLCINETQLDVGLKLFDESAAMVG